jgi:hypothetical protein
MYVPRYESFICYLVLFVSKNTMYARA